jgi:hypothetical protein
MLDKDVVIGMKVVPHSKSFLGPMEESNALIRANEINQPYLYVTKKGEGFDEVYWVLWIDEKPTGDFFLAKDFEPYVDPNVIDRHPSHVEMNQFGKITFK